MRPFRSSCASAPRGPRRTGGFTIIELLVAAAISLILTYAVVQMFDFVAKEARYGRASIELAGQLRNASRRVTTDLASVTATVRPLNDRHGLGYLEYVEGPGTDAVVMIRNTRTADPNDDYYTANLRTWATDYVDMDNDGIGEIDFPRLVPSETSVGGDVDDILMFTAYNPEEPFRGRQTTWAQNAGGNWVRTTVVIESKYAEIALWTTRDDKDRVRLHRRCLLIRPDVVGDAFYNDVLVPPDDLMVENPSETMDPEEDAEYRLCTFLQDNDISVRLDATRNRFVGNTLGDLQRRENRFAHERKNGYPYPIDIDELRRITPEMNPGWTLQDDPVGPFPSPTDGWMENRNPQIFPGPRYNDGVDVLLTEVLAFDVKVFDPEANVRFDTDTFHVTPSDPGYRHFAGSQLELGAFVDLGYRRQLEELGVPLAQLPPNSWFSGDPNTKSKLIPPALLLRTSTPPSSPIVSPTDAAGYRTYCTWSHYYEMNGDNENLTGTTANDAYTDGGSNGLDDDGNGLVDEHAEWDTQPPYLRPIPGIQVTIRVMEPNSRQVRQMTVTQNFAHE